MRLHGSGWPESWRQLPRVSLPSKKCPDTHFRGSRQSGSHGASVCVFSLLQLQPLPPTHHDRPLGHAMWSRPQNIGYSLRALYGGGHVLQPRRDCAYPITSSTEKAAFHGNDQTYLSKPGALFVRVQIYHVSVSRANEIFIWSA